MRKLILLILLLPGFAFAQTRQTGGISFTPQWNFKISGSDTTWQFGNTLMSPAQYPYFLTKYQLDQRYPSVTNSYNYSTPLNFIDTAKIIHFGAETSNLMMDATTVRQWYRLVGGTTIYTRTANNALLNNWTSPVACTGISGEFPEIFKIGATYYTFIKTPATTGDLYLYSSSDGLAWSVINSGNPVITKSATGTDWYANIYNVGVAVIGTTMHILVEGAANTGTYSNTAWLGYASADISSPTFTMPATPVFEGGNAQVIYIPERNSLLAMYGWIDNYATGTWKLRTATAPLTLNLSKAGSWDTGFLLFPNLGEVADPSFVFTPGKTHPAMMTYNYNQLQGYIAYTDVANNTLQLYNSVSQKQPYLNPVLPITPNGVNSTGPVNAVMLNTENNSGISIAASKTTGTGSQPAYQWRDSSGVRKFSMKYDHVTGDLITVNAAGSDIAKFNQAGKYTLYTTPATSGVGYEFLTWNTGTGDFEVANSTISTAIKNLSNTNSGDNAPNSLYSGLVTMTYPAAGIPLSTGTAWGSSITNNSGNWNTAYGWGNHAGLYPTYNGTGATGSWNINAATVTNGVYTTTFNTLGDARYARTAVSNTFSAPQTFLMDGATNGNGASVQAVNASGAGSQPSYNWNNHSGTKRFGLFLDVNSDNLYLTNNAGGQLMVVTQAGVVNVPKIQSSQVPSAGDDLVNKTALDAAVGSTGFLKGSTFLAQTYEVAPTTGSTVAPTKNFKSIIRPTGALAALTIQLPSSPSAGDIIWITITQPITTIIYTNGTAATAPTTLAARGEFSLVYSSVTSSWH